MDRWEQHGGRGPTEPQGRGAKPQPHCWAEVPQPGSLVTPVAARAQLGQATAHLSPSLHSDEDAEGAVLPKDKLISLCQCDPILRWMRSCDHILYQALVEILIPDVLRPVPSK